MSGIAFYAPMKSPRHPVPSGDRELAIGVQSALAKNTLGFDVDLASELRCYDATGDAELQQKLIANADTEIARLLSEERSGRWRAWVTYHNYYKAPDLLGPAICQRLDIPYLVIEASRSMRRRVGPWSEFAVRSDAACDQAAVIFYLTEHDRIALQRHRPEHQLLVHLPPFLQQTSLPQARVAQAADHCARLLSVGMHRKGDKFASYEIIAEMLPHLSTADWCLDIVGDGPARAEVETLFKPFGKRVAFLGQLDRAALDRVFENATVFLWPGVNEAFGMVYLEAQAWGLPVVAQDRPGVREVLSSAHSLVPPGDIHALAKIVDQIAASAKLRADMIEAGRRLVSERHLLGSAATLLSTQLECLLRDKDK